MDNTIRIITDSGCDISKENEEKYKGLLEIMPFMVTIQGKSYVDRQDIQAEEFYKVLKEQQEIPKHSQITAIQFEDKYRELYAQGVRTIIVDVINGAGSQTCSNAQLAKQNVADELKDLTVYIVDSQNYTLAYGYPVIEGMQEAGSRSERRERRFLPRRLGAPLRGVHRGLRPPAHEEIRQNNRSRKLPGRTHGTETADIPRG